MGDLRYQDLNDEQRGRIDAAQEALGGRREPRDGFWSRLFGGRRRGWEFDQHARVWYRQNRDGQYEFSRTRDGRILDTEELTAMKYEFSGNTREAFSALTRRLGVRVPLPERYRTSNDEGAQNE